MYSVIKWHHKKKKSGPLCKPPRTSMTACQMECLFSFFRMFWEKQWHLCKNDKSFDTFLFSPLLFLSFRWLFLSFRGFFSRFCGFFSRFCGFFPRFCGLFSSFLWSFLPFWRLFFSFRRLFSSFRWLFLSFRWLVVRVCVCVCVCVILIAARRSFTWRAIIPHPNNVSVGREGVKKVVNDWHVQQQRFRRRCLGLGRRGLCGVSKSGLRQFARLTRWRSRRRAGSVKVVRIGLCGDLCRGVITRVSVEETEIVVTGRGGVVRMDGFSESTLVRYTGMFRVKQSTNRRLNLPTSFQVKSHSAEKCGGWQCWWRKFKDSTFAQQKLRHQRCMRIKRREKIFCLFYDMMSTDGDHPLCRTVIIHAYGRFQPAKLGTINGEQETVCRGLIWRTRDSLPWLDLANKGI